MKRTFLLCLLLTVFQISYGQNSILDQYIRDAFDNNEGLKQQQIDLNQALYALKEAKSYFLPHISFNATYTKAQGGRTIDLPVGDMLNPVYSSLNQLTMSHQFPQIQNESILLNPDNFYDIKLHTTLPLINMELIYNKQIKKELISQQDAALKVYQRELVKDIKVAYYRYDQAIQSVHAYRNALELTRENIRVNESLLRNGKSNGTALTRAQAEKQKVEAAMNEAQNTVKNAQAYFNFLLNRSLDEAIVSDSSSNRQVETLLHQNESMMEREELQQLKTTSAIYEIHTKMQKSYLLPKLNTFLDAGSQSFAYNITDRSLYYFWGLNLQWDLFAGGKNTNKIRLSESDLQKSHSKYKETEKAFELQHQQARNNFNTAVLNYNNAVAQLNFAEQYLNDQNKVYKEGQLLYIELIDAQHQFTQAQIQMGIARSEIQIANAMLERVRAAYPLP